MTVDINIHKKISTFVVVDRRYNLCLQVTGYNAQIIIEEYQLDEKVGQIGIQTKYFDDFLFNLQTNEETLRSFIDHLISKFQEAISFSEVEEKEEKKA